MTTQEQIGWDNLPYSAEAEQAVIGSILVNPAAFYGIASFLKPDDFFMLRHKYIWQAFAKLTERGESVDYLTLSQELKTADNLADIGGAAYLTTLINNTPDSTHADVYAQIVNRTATRRRLLSAADAIKALAMNEELSTEEVERQATMNIMNVHTSAITAFTPMRAAVNDHFQRTEIAMESPNEMLGIPTGFKELNKYLRGWRKKKLYVIAGRPGMGKSSFLMSELMSMARLGLPVALFTQEMGVEEVTDNIIAAEMGVNVDAIATGSLTPLQWSQYVAVSGNVSKWPIYIDDTSALTPGQMNIRARQLKHECGLAAVFTDYIQLMSGGGEVKYSNRDQEIGYISRSLKGLAKDLDIPVISAAQLSREVEKREDKRPMLSDLRESGNIENDADVVMFLYRDDYYSKPYPALIVSNVEVAIAKHRGGRTGRLDVGFWGELKKFVEVKKIEGVM